MLITCHRPGGFDFGSFSLQHGENIVDDELWLLTITRLNPLLVEAWTKGPDAPIQVETDAGVRPEAKPVVSADATPAPPPASELARDKIALVEAAMYFSELEPLARGETRKTVLKAIEKRRVILDGDLG